MWALVLALGCGTPGAVDAEVPAEPMAAAVYTNGMWGERVLTVIAGLDEALLQLDGGDATGAATLSHDVYTHSFEPELEPLIRARVGRAEAASTEYRFGQLREALAAGDSRAARAHREALASALAEQAAVLDTARAVLRD